MNKTGMYLLKIVLLTYIVVVGFLYFTQHRLLYHPSVNTSLPEKYGLTMQSISLKTDDNVAISAWHSPPKEGHKHTILFAHGNAGTLGSRAGKFKAFIEHGMGVMGVSYRGYGASEGSPSEQGLYNDLRAAIDYLKANGVQENDIIMYGESLGTGVAVQMATEYDFKALALEAPFTSVVDRAQELYPFAPAWLIVKDRFDSLAKIKNVNEPLIIIHGNLDRIIPVHHGQRLFHEANTPKHFVLATERKHNNIPIQTIIKELHNFIDKN